MSRNLLAVTLAVLAVMDTAALAQQSPEAPPAASAASASPRKPEVIVEGQRAKLEPLIFAYVQQIAGSFYGEELSRWDRNVCPLVSGLATQEAEFILGRLSEVARASGIPLAGEHCKANLYILVTTQPQAVLRGMDKRNHYFTFGEASDVLVDEFITTPRPVRVWYHTGALTPEGQPLVSMSFPSYNVTGHIPTLGYEPDQTNASGQEQTAIDRSPGGVVGTGSNSWAQATRLSNNIILQIFRAFVIVDARQLEGATRGQIADYITMVSLAQIKTESRPADAQTILNLFNDGPKTSPPGMSDWDQAYLKSLYTTEQNSKLQRTLIAHEMVREVVP
jgi:hypothetical protein